MEITITQACIYKDGRCHGVFCDGSAVILHQGGMYSTYFSPSGEINRQVTLCTVGGTKAKLLKLIKLYNHSAFYPISAFTDEIYKVMSRDAKITSSTWQVPGIITVVQGTDQVNSFKYREDSDKICIVEQDSKGSLKYKSIDGEVSLTLNTAKNLFKLSYNFLLPHRKPTWNENSQNRVRLNHEYIHLSQIFHTSAYPLEWSPILNILWAAAGLETEPIDAEEIIIAIPTSQSGVIWKSDNVSPSVNLFNYFGENLLCYWEPEATFYVTGPNTLSVLIHEDQSLLEVSNDFFTHTREDNTIKFTTETVPINVRNANYKLIGFAKTCKDIQKLPQVQKLSEPPPLDDEEFQDGIKIENTVEGLAHFTAYNDKSIRVLFEDRTLIRIYSDFSVSALSRNGESARFNLENPYGFESYIPVCVEFYNWVFLSPNEQAKRANEAADRENLVMAEISKVERLTGRIPQMPVANYVEPISDDVSQSLMMAKKQLEETQELLRKLNQK